MANFENLIRGAMEGKDSSSPEVRERIYRSSRNALKRMIESNRGLTVEAALREQNALETAIGKIEEEFSQAALKRLNESGTRDPLQELKQILSTGPRGREIFPPDPDQEPEFQATKTFPPNVDTPNKGASGNAGMQSSDNSLAPQAVPAVDHEFQNVPDRPLPQAFSRRRKIQKRVTWLIVLLVTLALLVWLGVFLYNGVINGTLLSGYGPNNDLGPSSEQAQSEGYIIIVEPGDLSSLITAERGEAEIVNALNTNVIRMTSVRDDNNRQEPARPILLKLRPGILAQISEKTATFELYAKSGSAEPAQFTVECLFGNIGTCGRKRFRVGAQPEASVFAVEFDRITNLQRDAFIAINTDTTSNAVLTGRGDIIDLLYARLRVN